MPEGMTEPPELLDDIGHGPSNFDLRL
jgi:hypothetical protein